MGVQVASANNAIVLIVVAIAIVYARAALRIENAITRIGITGIDGAGISIVTML
jgi:hypothetical protein